MKLQSKMELLGRYGCLLMSYAYAAYMNEASKEEIDSGFLETAVASIALLCLDDESIIGPECYVKDAQALLNKISPNSKKYKVTKKDITSFKDLPLTGFAVVRFDYNGNSHFVLAKDQAIVYDGLDDSKCRKLGKPTTARIIEEI